MVPTDDVYNAWPEEVEIWVYRGDIFGTEWEMDLEDFSLGDPPGPANLNEPGVVLSGHIRYTADDLGDPAAVFDIQKVNAALRTIRPIMWPTETAKLVRNGFYDLQITKGTFTRTFLQGKVKLGKDKTRA